MEMLSASERVNPGKAVDDVLPSRKDDGDVKAENESCGNVAGVLAADDGDALEDSSIFIYYFIIT